jgi:hypothetical protein
MASDLFQSYNHPVQNPQPYTQQFGTPKDAALSRVQQMGISIPQNISNDPNAILQYVMQSGKIPQIQNRIQMAQNFLMSQMGARH